MKNIAVIVIAASAANNVDVDAKEQDHSKCCLKICFIFLVFGFRLNNSMNGVNFIFLLCNRCVLCLTGRGMDSLYIYQFDRVRGHTSN